MLECVIRSDGTANTKRCPCFPDPSSARIHDPEYSCICRMRGSSAITLTSPFAVIISTKVSLSYLMLIPSLASGFTFPNSLIWGFLSSPIVSRIRRRMVPLTYFGAVRQLPFTDDVLELSFHHLFYLPEDFIYVPKEKCAWFLSLNLFAAFIILWIL